MGWHDSHPIVRVNWYDAMEYCEWLSQKLNRNVTLPTEAQWEYAARGGKLSKGYMYSGTESSDYSYDDYGSNTVTHGSSNELGLFGMSGSVWEWCSDWYQKDYYEISPLENPKGPNSGKYKVIRGGGASAIHAKNAYGYSRVSARGKDDPILSRTRFGGFRVVSN